MLICDVQKRWESQQWNAQVVDPGIAANHELGVRDPEPIAKVSVASSDLWSFGPEIAQIEDWNALGTDPDQQALTIVSFETSIELKSIGRVIEPTVLRLAKERGTRWVQCIVPVPLQRGSHYEPYTRLQMVVWGESNSEMSHALMANGFRPVAYKPMPDGIEMCWTWENRYR